jgi:hypothetical protein
MSGLTYILERYVRVERRGLPGVNCPPRELCELEPAMRKDKKQVIGDEIGDEQIKLFLNFEPVDATSPSLHKLIKGYRGLRVDDFERFLTFFVEAGYDLNGKDEHGNDFVALIQDQRNAEEYIELFNKARG